MKNSGKRSQALAIRCYRLREQGLSLAEIAEMTGVDRDKVYNRIILGERLESLKWLLGTDVQI